MTEEAVEKVIVEVIAQAGANSMKDMGKVMGIVKPRSEHAKGKRGATDRIVLPRIKEPIRLSRNHPGLRLLQYLRDETHKHAVAYQRKTRRKSTLTSVLEGIAGVGTTRRRALLVHLGSVRAVANADLEQLMSVPGVGPQMALNIYGVFHPDE